MPKRKSVGDHTVLFRWYNEGPRQWGEAYMAKHLWKFEGMYSRDDVKQDAILIYTRCFRYHRSPCGRYGKPKADIFKIYRASMAGLVSKRALQCFPNSHAYAEERGKVVKQIDEIEEYVPLDSTLSDCLAKSFEDPDQLRDVEQSLSILSDTLESLPKELADVLRILVRDFCGEPCINRRKAKKLDGNTRHESLSVAIARVLGLDRSRDLVAELASALGRPRNL